MYSYEYVTPTSIFLHSLLITYRNGTYEKLLIELKNVKIKRRNYHKGILHLIGQRY